MPAEKFTCIFMKEYIGGDHDVAVGFEPDWVGQLKAPITVKRIYDSASPADGCRVLVDRLWPRGLKKRDAAVDLWLKDIAPSPTLRKWFAHDPQKWDAFKAKYFRELAQQEKHVFRLEKQARKWQVTLLFAAKDERFNNAVALKQYVETASRNNFEPDGKTEQCQNTA
jgi:uncharacterized protein YeaO (DUF488 family)